MMSWIKKLMILTLGERNKMGQKINYEQLENIINTLTRNDIPSAVVTNLLSIKSLSELNVVQYNYLLLLIKSNGGN